MGACLGKKRHSHCRNAACSSQDGVIKHVTQQDSCFDDVLNCMMRSFVDDQDDPTKLYNWIT
jgi:hypothetical protein